MAYQLVQVSGNEKTGPIPVSTSEMQTCPSACPLKQNGCYAGYGPIHMNWLKVTEGIRGDSWEEFVRKVAALPHGQLWRHNQAGDLPGEDNRIDGVMLQQLVEANRGRRGFTYTHKPMWIAANREAVRKANEDGFTINLSANNPFEVDALVDLGIAPVATMLPKHFTQVAYTPKGRTIITCPASYDDNITCARCQLCQIRDRKSVVGFPTHGTGQRYAEEIALG